jgi:hypothetical protein
MERSASQNSGKLNLVSYQLNTFILYEYPKCGGYTLALNSAFNIFFPFSCIIIQERTHTPETIKLV